MSYYALQSFILPGYDFPADETLYLRSINENVNLDRNKTVLNFDKNGIVSFDTYYNSFTVSKWKESCSFQDLLLNMTGTGRFQVKFGLHRLGQEHVFLGEYDVDLSESETSLPIPSWGEFERGMLYVTVKCLSGSGALSALSWATTSQPITDVKLGIVITHFNRKKFVLPAIKRLKAGLLEDNFFGGRVDVVVVDNSRNITDEEAQGITLIPNLNLGGTGGFTRGLLSLKDDGSFSHCLFMDDDASCEVESIKRAYMFMSYAKDSKTCLSGALLRDIESYRLFEKGAKFDGVVKPLKQGLDLRHVHDLLLSEEGFNEVDYGAWWFFIFSIAEVENFAFPFFVRGDDIIFGLRNNFNIQTLNGVSCWGEDFGLKSGPMTAYLDTRSHLVHNTSYLGSGFKKTALIISRLFFMNLLSYNYEAARCVSLSLEDFIRGPEAWKGDIDASKARKRVQETVVNEKLVPMCKEDYDLIYSSGLEESKFKFILRILTLNGYLIPSFFMKDDVVYQPKGFRAVFRQIFGIKKVLFFNEVEQSGYVSSYSKRRALKELFIFVKLVLKFGVKFKKLSSSYSASLPEMTSEKFWQNVYEGKEY